MTLTNEVKDCESLQSYVCKAMNTRTFCRSLMPAKHRVTAKEYCIAGNFREVQNFAFFEGRAVNAKIKNGTNSHAPVHAKGFLALKHEY